MPSETLARRRREPPSTYRVNENSPAAAAAADRQVDQRAAPRWRRHRSGQRASTRDVRRHAGRQALEKHSFVIRGKLAQVAEATIRRRCAAALLVCKAPDLGEPQHLDVLERRQPYEIAKSVLSERACGCACWQLGQCHGFREVLVDETPALHAMRRRDKAGPSPSVRCASAVIDCNQSSRRARVA